MYCPPQTLVGWIGCFELVECAIQLSNVTLVGNVQVSTRSCQSFEKSLAKLIQGSAEIFDGKLSHSTLISKIEGVRSDLLTWANIYWSDDWKGFMFACSAQAGSTRFCLSQWCSIAACSCLKSETQGWNLGKDVCGGVHCSGQLELCEQCNYETINARWKLVKLQKLSSNPRDFTWTDMSTLYNESSKSYHNLGTPLWVVQR